MYPASLPIPPNSSMSCWPRAVTRARVPSPKPNVPRSSTLAPLPRTVAPAPSTSIPAPSSRTSEFDAVAAEVERELNALDERLADLEPDEDAA